MKTYRVEADYNDALRIMTTLAGCNTCSVVVIGTSGNNVTFDAIPVNPTMAGNVVNYLRGCLSCGVRDWNVIEAA